MPLSTAVRKMKMLIKIAAAIGLMITIAVAGYLAEPVQPVTGQTAVYNAPGVVIDAGHGGYDGGAEHGGVMEKDINLEITLQLRELLLATGYRVALTRYGDYSLIEEQEITGTKKREDMARRLAVIEKNAPDVVILIHCNALRSPLWSGAQTFYQPEFDQGKLLAEDVQYYLSKFTDTNRESKPLDLYLLRESSIIGCLVEAGFISHPGERQLLQQVQYQRRLSLAIWLGIGRYTHYPQGH